MKLIFKQYIAVSLCFVLFSLGGYLSVSAQSTEITIEGIVTDQEKELLTGVTVRVENATQGSMTDIDGKFKVKCEPGSTLEFTYVGFNPQKAKAVNGMTIEMSENAIALSEAVIVGVGYGKMRKSDLTGSISSVNQDNLKKGVVSSAEQLLQGKISGLSVVQGSGDPASGATLRLRGGTSLSASSSPLVVVDGIAGVDINTVQPSEIISVDVLKDASAAAIYGSRGANGVIIITTNRSGDTPRKSIEYNGYMAVGYVAKHMDLLSANQWRQYVRENNIANAIDFGDNTDWQKELERTALTQSHSLHFSNISKEGGYSATLSYFDSEGVIKRSDMQRLAGNISAHQKAFNNRLRLEAGLNGNFDTWHPIDNRIFQRAANLNPTVGVKDENGKYISIGGTLTENPVEILNNRSQKDTRHRFLGYGKTELKIIEGLEATAIASYEYNSFQDRLHKPTYAMMEGISEKGFAQKTISDYTTKQIETFANYNKDFGDQHRFNAMAGYSYWINDFEGSGAMRRGFDTDALGYDNIGAGTDFRQGDVYSYRGQAKLASFYGRANYTLMSKYMFTATLRRDGSSKLGKNDQWDYFPSASAAWRVSDEKFMEGAKGWLDNLKFRLGYGVTGNQDIESYKSQALLVPTGGAYYDPVTNSWKNSYIPDQNANPDLKWEKTEQFNLGIDFNLFQRVTASIELYSKKTKDLLWTYPVPQPPYLVNNMMANVGNLSNKGIELALSAKVLQIDNFQWNANLTLSYNKQKIAKLSNEKYKEQGFNTGSLHNLSGLSGIYAQMVKEGYPVGSFFGPKAIGLDEDGKYILETDKDGKVIDDFYLGSAQPKVNLGIAMDFIYRDFDFNVSGYGMFGQKVLNATYMSMFDPARLPAQNVPDHYLKKGIKDVVTYSDYWVEDGSFFRLQSVTLGYTLPFNLKKVGFNKIRFYMTGENLFVITKYSGIDPEVNINGIDNPGMDMYNMYPRPRTFSLGLNLSF